MKLHRGPFDGTGWPVLNSTPHVILSPGGQRLYGIITYITKRQGIMVVTTTHRRKFGAITKRFKKTKYLKSWEEVNPPRKMLAASGKILDAASPD